MGILSAGTKTVRAHRLPFPAALQLSTSAVLVPLCQGAPNDRVRWTQFGHRFVQGRYQRRSVRRFDVHGRFPASVPSSSPSSVSIGEQETSKSGRPTRGSGGRRSLASAAENHRMPYSVQHKGGRCIIHSGCTLRVRTPLSRIAAESRMRHRLLRQPWIWNASAGSFTRLSDIAMPSRNASQVTRRSKRHCFPCDSTCGHRR